MDPRVRGAGPRQRPDRIGSGPLGVLALVLAAALLLGTATACGGSAPAPVQLGPVTRAEAQQLLDRRARALRNGNRAVFLSTLDRSDPGLVARQRRYFASIAQLPIGLLRYRVSATDWPSPLRASSWGSDVILPEVVLSTQLAGFDRVPVQRLTGFAIGRRDGRVVIVSDRTGGDRPFPGDTPPPWELVRIRTQTTGSVLQLYDDRTWAEAAALSTVFFNGVAQVRSAVPWDWDGRVVVYVFASQAVLDSYQGVPGGSITHLGAMTFAVPARTGGTEAAATRFTLLPSSLQAGEPFLGRLVRHELTHVALGDRSEGVPSWLVEGLAEYVGARDLRATDRRIAAVAVQRAREPVSAMPASAGFNGPDQDWNYALSWMACDYLAATRGEPSLWALLAAMHAGGAGTPDSGQDAVLERVVGLDSAQLARRAAQRIRREFG